MSSARTPARARRLRFPGWKHALMTCVVVAAIWSSNPDVGNGAGSTSVVSVTVLPAISLSNQCGQRPAWAIGSVVAGSSALTATGASVCRFTFSSSNSSAMLQIYQPDRTGNAMVGIPTGWDWKLNGDGQQDISHAGTGMIILQDQWDVTGAFQRSMDGGATWQSFAPGGGTTRYTAVVSTTVGWRAGDGLVRVSSNLNANPPTWTNVGNAPATIAGIDAVDATTAWAINGPNARYTANAGATAWSSRSLGACGYAEEIDAVSSTTAFVAGNGAVCRSINSNGSAWTLLSSGGAASAYANDVMASPGTPATVWFAADGGRVFRSTNSGTLWAEVTPVPANVNLESIDVVSATEAWVGGLDGLVFHTIDSGVSWARAYVPFTAPVDNLAAPGGTSLVMSADGGPEMHTANGTSWNSYTGTLNDLRDVDSIDDQTMIASDSDGNVLYTSDSATTWVRKPTGVAGTNFHGVAMIDQQRFIAVGDQGGIVTSDDGGATWRSRVSGTTADLWDVESDSQGRTVAVGTGGVILRSPDQGATWTLQASAGGWLRRVDFHSGTPMVAVGASGLIRRSVDDGATWTTPVSGVTGRLDSVSVASPTVVYAAQDGSLAKSIDGGATWTVSGIGGMSNVASVSEDQVWLTTSGSAGWTQWANYSLDGGSTWNDPFGSQDPNVSFIHPLDNGQIVFTGRANATRVSELPPQIPDYTAGGWSGSTSFFGVCLQAVGGAASVGAWGADASGTCTAADSDPWHGVPIAPTKVAQTLAPGTGQADFVWGVRTKNDLAPGQYAASVVVQASAPNV